MRKCLMKFSRICEGGAVPSFLYFPRPRCIDAVIWFLLRGRVLRPDDACQKRFSWFSDWIPKVQKRMSLARCVFHGFQIGVIGLKRCKSV